MPAGWASGVGDDDLRRAPEAAIAKTKTLTDKPFGVNLRADATDAPGGSTC